MLSLKKPIGTTICDASRAYGEVAHAAVYLSLLIALPTCLQHLFRIPAPISGNLYSKRYFPVMGAPAPFHYDTIYLIIIILFIFHLRTLLLPPFKIIWFRKGPGVYGVSEGGDNKGGQLGI